MPYLRLQIVMVMAAAWPVPVDDVVSVERAAGERALGVSGDMLVCRATPLRQVIAEFNRHHVRQLVIADPALHEVRVACRFDPKDLDGFLKALVGSKIASVATANDREIRLVQPETP